MSSIVFTTVHPCSIFSSYRTSCSIISIAIIQLINLSWTETVDGISIAIFVLTLHRQRNTTRAAVLTIIIISIGARNPSRTHQLVTFTEITLKINGTDITGLLGSIDI